MLRNFFDLFQNSYFQNSKFPNLEKFPKLSSGIFNEEKSKESLFKVSNNNTRRKCRIYSKLTTIALEESGTSTCTRGKFFQNLQYLYKHTTCRRGNDRGMHVVCL